MSQSKAHTLSFIGLHVVYPALEAILASSQLLYYETLLVRMSQPRLYCSRLYRGADKSLDRPGSKQAAPVKSVMSRGMD